MAHSDPSSTGSTIIPCLRYRNALAAIDWLQRAFGFHAQAVAASATVCTAGKSLPMIDTFPAAIPQSAWAAPATDGFVPVSLLFEK